MAGIASIPSSRISDSFAQQRLTQQYQADQLDMFRLQNQISTGQRILLPSDDGPSALRAITLQRLLERKSQLDTNVQTGQSFLAATDTALSDISNTLGDLRGSVLGVAGTTVSEQERTAVIAEVSRTLEQLIQSGNRKFRGRYLFSGSHTSTQPYRLEGDYVKYFGNEGSVSSYSDLSVLFASNSSGNTVFGGISEGVQGSTDLNPQLTTDTLLSSLHGGQGVAVEGALQISDGSSISIVDLSRATTLGDVARFIEENPPSGREVTVTVTGQGLTLQLDSAGGGNLTVLEVGSGVAARDLGILEESGTLTNPLVGNDLNPRLLGTTRLDTLLGTKANVRIQSSGANNNLRLDANSNGAHFNGVAVQFVDDQLLQANGGLAAGNEFAVLDGSPRAAQASIQFPGSNNDLRLQANSTGTSFNQVRVDVLSTETGGSPTASYDSVNKILTLNLEADGSSDANQVITAIAGIAGNPFSAVLDSSVEVGNTGLGTIASFSQASFTNTGNSGGEADTLYVHIAPGETNANQVIAAINAQGAFTASLEAADTDLPIQAGTGLVSVDATGTTSGGGGESLDQTSGVQVINGGKTYTFDFSNAKTVSDLLNLFNGSEAGLHAQINATGNGVDVRSRISGSDFQIGELGGRSATQLGIRTYHGQTRLEDLNYGVGLPTGSGDDLTITAGDGTTFGVDLSGASTIDEVLNRINGNPANLGLINAQLASVGNGITLIDTSAGSGDLVVGTVEGSQAAEYLGFVPEGQTEIRSSTGTLQSTDRNYLENDSVFSTLVRLREALSTNDIPAMERAVARIDLDIDRVSFARSEVGARQQGLELAQTNLQDEDVLLQTALSDEKDVDLVEAISSFMARQASLEASLRVSASIFQLSLLDFL